MSINVAPKLPPYAIDQFLARRRAEKRVEGIRSAAIEAQLDKGVPLTDALRIVDGLKPGEFNRMMTPVVASQITDERNVIHAAELRIVGHLRTLAEQGNTVIVYPIEEGRSHILVWAPDSDRENDDAVVSIQIAGDAATTLLDDDSTGNIAEA